MRNSKLFIISGLLWLLAASCSNMPEHAKYIPKDAIAVVGLNTKALSKKIAWNAIMGSKLLDEMKAKMPDKSAAAEGLEDAGIDVLNTTYFYYTHNAAIGSYNYITAIVPLSDAKKWETYVLKNFNNPAIKEVNKHKEALLEKDIYAAWDNDMAIVRKGFSNEFSDTEFSDTDTLMANAPVANTDLNPEKMATDMQTAFMIQKDNEITTDKRFSKLQTQSDDITIWINYDVMMTKINALGNGFTGGLALGNSLWKDAALAGGLNFEKGKVEGDINYYVSEEMGEVYSKFGGKNADKDMIDRLPMQNLNAIMAANISMEGMKSMLEKMGLLGFMSLGLAQSNLTADDVFQSFTGDAAISLSDFKTYPSTQTIPDLNGESSYTQTVNDASSNYIFVMKIHDNEKFMKLFSYLQSQNAFETIDAQTHKFAGKDSLFLVNDKNFAVFSNNPAIAKNYLQGTYSTQPKPEQVKKNVYGHPTGAFFDVQSFLAGITTANTQRDREMLDVTKKTFTDIVINGGEHKKNAFAYKASLNMVNKDENSLLQLLDYSYKLKEINDREKQIPTAMPVAARADTTMHN